MKPLLVLLLSLAYMRLMLETDTTTGLWLSSVGLLGIYWAAGSVMQSRRNRECD